MNRNLLFVALALLTWGFGEGLFFNFQPIYLKSLGSDEQQIGFILGAFGAAMAITHIPAGRLADRIGRRPLLFAAWIMGLIATIIMAMARTLPLFVAGMLLYGLTAFVASPLSSYVTAARGKWSVTTALSLTTATFNTGMILGPVTGGWIGDHFGLRTIYFVAAGFFTVSTLCILFIQKQPIDHHDPEMPPPGLLNNFRLMSYIGIVAFAVFAMYLPQPLTPNFLEDVRGFSLGNVGIIFTCGALGNALLAIFLSRAKPYGGFLVAQTMVAAFAFIIWRGISLPILALGYFLLGGFRAARPLALAQARELVHDSQMGLTYGVMETVNSVIFILTPPLAGFLYKIDPATNYPFALGLIAVSVLISLILPRRLLHV
ncbi:MAG: MFS transporter [Anaerolineales bacterium]|nr:MFS transporter [Anaerolineales bacterium]NUQ83816.1 MFS transporter [Anaerolineales bacterium]